MVEIVPSFNVGSVAAETWLYFIVMSEFHIVFIYFFVPVVSTATAYNIPTYDKYATNITPR